jgi:hypothetical protein
MIPRLPTIHSLEDFRFLYFKYKDTIGFTIGIILLLITITIIVFIKVVMPTAGNWFSIQHEVDDTKNRIALLTSNQNKLASIDEVVVTRQFVTATEALPYEKNYAGFVSAIDNATLISGMRRDDYSFVVGNLSTKSAQLSPNTAIPVKIALKGDIDKLLIFLQTLQKTVPLSEIVLVSAHNSSANVEINFFYKHKSENLQIPYTDPIRILTTKNDAVLKTLDGWLEQSSGVSPAITPDDIASGSAL